LHTGNQPVVEAPAKVAATNAPVVETKPIATTPTQGSLLTSTTKRPVDEALSTNAPERVAVEPAATETATGTSKVGNSALENAVGKSLKSKYGEAAQYDRITIADQAKKAVAVTEDPAKLERIIAGTDPLPDGLRATALIDAVERHPVLGKDADLLVKLSKSKLASESSYSAQELRLAAERVDNSPIEVMKQVREARIKALEKKTKTTAAKAVSDEVKQIRAAKPKIEKETWDHLLIL
jgi:hypothetical protein